MKVSSIGESKLQGEGKIQFQQQQQQHHAAASNEDDGDDDFDSNASLETDDDPSRKDGEGGGELSRLRREKRLAMNRESARARRKRKKVLLETLEQQVAELAKRNQRYQAVNEALTGQVRQLESELSMARSTIALLTNQQQAHAGAAAASSFSMGGAAAANLQHQDAFRRLLQAQQGGSSAGGFFGGGQPNLGQSARGFADEALFRQSALERALAQRAGAGAGSDLAMSTALLDRHGFQSSSIQNTVRIHLSRTLKLSRSPTQGYIQSQPYLIQQRILTRAYLLLFLAFSSFSVGSFRPGTRAQLSPTLYAVARCHV